MCLGYSENTNKQMKEQLEAEGSVTCFKLLRFYFTSPDTTNPFVKVGDKCVVLKPYFQRGVACVGVYNSSRKSKEISEENGDEGKRPFGGYDLINQGIHVSLRASDLDSERMFTNDSEIFYHRINCKSLADYPLGTMFAVIIPVKCYKEDFVAGGVCTLGYSAVFMKVEIKEEDLVDVIRSTVKGKTVAK